MKPDGEVAVAESEVELSELLQKFVHKARNPLATIRSSAQLVQHLTRPTGEVAEYFDGILAEVDRLDASLRDLKRFARLAPRAAEPIDVQELVLEAVARARQAAREAKVSLDVAAGSPIAAGVLAAKANREQVCEALGELLSNAVRCTAPGGTVTLGWSAANGAVCLYVDDGCPGIAAAVAERMFQPFYSGDGRGTGMGLNLVARTAQLAGGRLEWANRPGGGCRFTLALPGA